MRGTVIVSCYNQYRYIRACLDSILNQQVDFAFDIMIADDCSTDGTIDILMEYKSLYPEKIFVVIREENLGTEKNYIAAHQAASSDIIFHIDGDDLMLPGKLQKQYNLFKANESVNIVFHRALYFSDNGLYNAETGTPLASINGIRYFNLKDLALWGPITVHSAYSYRKSSRNLQWPEKKCTEWYFAMDSLLISGLGAYIDEVLIKYRCNSGGSSYLSSKKGKIKAYNIYYTDILYYFDKFPQLRTALYSNYLVTALAMLKNGCGFSKKTLYFLLKKCYLFNISNFRQTLAMRRVVAPEKRNR